MIPTNMTHEHKWLLILSAAVLSMLTLFLAFKTWLVFKEAGQVGKPVPYEYTVSIEGVGIAYAKPDISKITFYVESKKPTLEEAQKDNTQQMNGLLEKLVASGIERKDIQTTYYNSYEDQIYDYERSEYKSFGWIVSQSIELTLRDLEKVPATLALLGQNGATNISGPNFATENDSAVLSEAREKALADAKQKADAISSQLGVKLGQPTSYSEWKDEGGSMFGYTAKAEMGGPAADAAPTIEAGEDMIKLHVNVSYVITR